MKTKLKYLLRGGYVTSQNYGDEHFISGKMLIGLYGLNPRECKIWQPNVRYGNSTDGLIVLEPRDDGNYNLES